MASYWKLVNEKEYNKNKKENKYKKAYCVQLDKDNFLYLPDREGFVKFFKNVEYLRQNLKDFTFISAKNKNSNVENINGVGEYHRSVLDINNKCKGGIMFLPAMKLGGELLQKLNEYKQECKRKFESEAPRYVSYD